MDGMMLSIVFDCLIGLLRAVSVTAQARPASGPESMMPMILMVGAMFVILYIIVLRPQKTEQKKRQEMIDKVAKGDKLVTNGGIHGTVESVSAGKATVTLSIAPKVSIEVSKWAISTVTPRARGDKENGKENAENNGK